MNLEAIGNRLKQIRTQASLTQEKMAAIIGKERSVYARMERGSSAPTLETLYLLKKTFNISVDWLISGNGPMHDKDKSFDVFSGQAGTVPESVFEQIRQGNKPNPDIIQVIGEAMLSNTKFYNKTLLEYLLVWKA